MRWTINNTVTQRLEVLFQFFRTRFILLGTIVTLPFVIYGWSPANSQTIADNPSACDCNTITISPAEEEGGCPASVKREACPIYREMEQWQQTLKKQKEERELEQRMIPRRAVPK